MRIKTSFALLVLLATLLPPPSDATEAHFALSRSEPEAGSVVAAPESIRLWFTQEPQANTMSIRLLVTGGAPVETGAVQQDPEDGTAFSVTVDSLSPGEYTVTWRAIGADGHVVRGDFAFTVGDS